VGKPKAPDDFDSRAGVSFTRRSAFFQNTAKIGSSSDRQAKRPAKGVGDLAADADDLKAKLQLQQVFVARRQGKPAAQVAERFVMPAELA
jgi:hypothetical protein